SDAVCFGPLAQRGAVSAVAIGQFIENTRTDCLKVFDVNLRGDYFSAELIDASLHHCSILKISDEELPVVADLLGVSGSNEDIAAEILKCYPLQYVVLTLGKKGSAAYDGKTVCKVPIYDSGPVVDTVGCGDSFTASLTVCLLQGVQIEDAMEQAAKVAGDVASCPGAMPEIPDLI
ncbi:MAG: carbohydrate kinase family protein, partial [Kiritimatiellales bacterium]